jgi:hypothetical protein
MVSHERSPNYHVCLAPESCHWGLYVEISHSAKPNIISQYLLVVASLREYLFERTFSPDPTSYLVYHGATGMGD